MKDKELERSIYMVNSAISSVVSEWKKFNPEGAKRIYAHWENLKLYLRDNVEVSKRGKNES